MTIYAIAENQKYLMSVDLQGTLALGLKVYPLKGVNIAGSLITALSISATRVDENTRNAIKYITINNSSDVLVLYYFGLQCCFHVGLNVIFKTKDVNCIILL